MTVHIGGGAYIRFFAAENTMAEKFSIVHCDVAAFRYVGKCRGSKVEWSRHSPVHILANQILIGFLPRPMRSTVT